MEKFNASYVGLRNELIGHMKGTQLNVLDIGCATGVNGRFLLDNKIAKNIIGVEFDHDMANLASQFYNKVYVGDLNSEQFIELILDCNLTFDYIIYGDILEHLINPAKVLEQLNKLLNREGKIIISVPNISHIELFIQVYVKGTWPKNERGIFDKTHLSWFTRKDIIDLVKRAGFNNVKYYRKYRSRDAIGSKFNFYTKVLKKINKDWVTFQHILICSND